MAFRRFDDSITPGSAVPVRVKNGLRTCYIASGAIAVDGADLMFYVGANAGGNPTNGIKVANGTRFLFVGWPLADVFVAQVTAGGTATFQVVVGDTLEEAMSVRS